MSPFLILVLAGLFSRFGYQMARSPVLPRFAQDLGATLGPILIGLLIGSPCYARTLRTLVGFLVSAALPFA